MRICFISPSVGRYGAELALLELLQGLTRPNIDMLVLVPKKGPLLDELDRLNIEWRIVFCPMWASPPKWFAYRLRRLLKTMLAGVQVARLIKTWDADIVYTNTVVTGVGALAARLTRRPHVWHSHESLGEDASQDLDLGRRAVTYLMEHLSAAIIVTSRSAESDYRHFRSQGKVHVVYQSVTLPPNIASKPVKPRPFFQCIVVGSLQLWKGQDQAISALAELTSRGINMHLLLVGGEGESYRANLVQQAEDLGVTDRITFHGYAQDPLPLIRDADAVLVCSRGETFGRVTVEAMLAGKPVIGSNRGATPEIIRHGKTGLLYEWGNVGDLAEKIQFLYDNPQEGLRIGSAAQQWADKRFTRDRYAQEVLEILSAVAPNAAVPE